MSSLPDPPQNPALPYRRSSAYPRSVEGTGQDLSWTPGQDLQVGRSGDFVYQSGSDLITQALLRRLYTPPEGYRRWVRDVRGLRLADVNYANEAYRYLAAPLPEKHLAELRDAVWNCARQEARIEVLRLTVQPSPVQAAKVEMDLFYRIRGEEELRRMNHLLVSPPSP
jgi:hypothetical protein